MASGHEERAEWVGVLERLARPVLTAMAEGRLRRDMPVEHHPDVARDDRSRVTHLEAIGRLLAGVAPWLESSPGQVEEPLRQELADLARRAVRNAVDPRSPDYCNFTAGGQPLVDAAFLAHAILRAPRELWEKLEPSDRHLITVAMRSTRVIQPGFSNWLLFSAMVEALLHHAGEADWDRLRVDYAVRQHEQWYKGDGTYGDGPELHWDYYNSFVIQPMLIDVLEAVGRHHPRWQELRGPVLKRAARYAAVQERLISPEGTFPPIGRSLAYRAGALQLLGQVALRHELPRELSPAQVRCAMTAVLRRTMNAPGTFDDNGWLTIGLCGHQPGLGERYISTGSTYLCAVALLPLGLPPTDPFWTSPPQDWTSRKAWSGQEIPIDHAL